MNELRAGAPAPPASGRRRRSVPDLIATVLLMLLSLVVALGSMYWGALSIMLTDPCTPNTCDFDTIDVGTALAVGGVWMPALLGIIAAIVLLVLRRRAWLAPTIGIVCTLVIETVGVSLISGAVDTS